MNFVQHLKSLKLRTIDDCDIALEKLSAQYNPERFRLYKSTCLPGKVLNIYHSPHVQFLNLYKREGKTVFKILQSTPYYKMQKLYGRNKHWIKDKINKFIDVYHDIKQHGFEGKIMVLDKPIIQNKYNSGFEIYEGHHRCACAIALGMRKIPAVTMRII